MNPHSREQVFHVIVSSMRSVTPGVEKIDERTALMGAGAVLDSVGFVTLLIAIEQNLSGAVDLSTSFLDQDGTPEGPHPFRTVGSLTDHVTSLMPQKP
jgi:D-alanine--poly(phosphoribitol) ligase subunit 2